MGQSVRTLVMTLLLLFACRSNEALAVQSQIEMAIQGAVVATRDQDIDAYMTFVPIGSDILTEFGEVVSREQLRTNVLRDWAIIPKTLNIGVTLDSLHLLGDSAVVFTSQQWERLMLQRDGVTIDTVLTTQAHRELWRSTNNGWRAFRVEELGGSVWINGVQYDPPPGA